MRPIDVRWGMAEPAFDRSHTLVLAYTLPRFGAQQYECEGTSIVMGRDEACQIRWNRTGVESIAPRHAEIIVKHGVPTIRAVDRRQTLWINGRRQVEAPLRDGDHLRLGRLDGPEVKIIRLVLQPTSEVTPIGTDDDPTALFALPMQRSSIEATAVGLIVPPGMKPHLDDRTRAAAVILQAKPTPPKAPPPAPSEKVKPNVPENVKHEDATLMARVARDLERARAKSGGQQSGNTMMIVASAVAAARKSADSQTHRWRRLASAIAIAAVSVVAVLAGVIWSQKQTINALAKEKVAIDAEIQTIQQQMDTEADSAKLVELDERLEQLVGRASEKVVQLRQKNARRAKELEQPADELELEIKKILEHFNAQTYAIPPIFKTALREQLDGLKRNQNLSNAYARRNKYWPTIRRAFVAKQLPEQLGYIAFTESAFDPKAVNSRSHASGMWQMMEEAARGCGLTVNPKIDERFDVERSSEAAACHISKLMVEFGEQSFMLALASYNRGENGVRRALHQVAKEPGGYKRRDFWHLYRLKLLPTETRDYVPRVLAAAIVFENPKKYGIVSAGQ